MSDDARPLIDNPYRASHTPIYAGGVNVTDLMARAWDRGFAAGDERLRSDFQAAASPDERLREALREIVAAFPPTPDREMDEEEVDQWYADHGDWFQRLRALAAADREKPDEQVGVCDIHGAGDEPCECDEWAPAPPVSDDPVNDPETNT